MKSFFTVLTFVTAALAASRTSAPSGCVVVKKSPSSGQFSTIQKAVDSLSTTSSSKQCIFIDQGTYSEQVLVPARTAQLTIYGYTADTSSYSGNKVTITAKKSQADGLTDDETGTLRVKAKNFKLYNVNVVNAYGQGSQAIALSSYADSGFYGCQFTGFQDTILTQQGNQLYSKCLIQGATDVIFGQKSMAWFEKCDLRAVSAKLGYFTANGAASSSAKSEYVFNSCTVAAASGATVPDGAFYLGRPWGAYAQVVYQKTTMTGIINSKGWSVWSTSDARTGNVLFGEYSDTGIGSQGSRATFSKKLSSAVAISSILGSGYASAGYYDASYM
ncbi:Pectinesterase [Colletotrichum gloeosporioides]|uniref:pectinesterase n=1 Tax=Colletotrichum gloeosporioides TaxID=474922 RepID=A0A8H4FNS5_COLGL|nr:Pectinesterase [Colletotrichum gloeosporioides]KAF3808910.1 Pectinesterase [Colletotrichum gloeosporioides]